MEALKRFLSAIAGSKKAVAAVAAVLFVFLAPILGKVGLTVTEDELQQVLGVAIAYLVGQGLADTGKERAKLEAAKAAPVPAPAPTPAPAPELPLPASTQASEEA